MGSYLGSMGVASVAGYLMLAFIDFIILRATIIPLLFQHQLVILVGQVSQGHVHLSKRLGRAISGANALSTVKLSALISS